MGNAEYMGEEHELKNTTASKIINSLAEMGTKEVKSTGKFTIPGLVMIKTRHKPATKACKKEIFGEMRLVKARPARTVVKAFPVAALKQSVLSCQRSACPICIYLSWICCEADT